MPLRVVDRVVVLLSVAVVVAGVVPMVARTAVPPAVASAEPFVTSSGRSFEVDGAPFRFVGVTIFDAASSDRYSCRVGSRMSDARLADTLRRLHDEAGVTVVRFWAYQTYLQGATYWGGMDRVIAAARDAGMRVIPVLEDGPGNCTTVPTPSPKNEYRGDTWYTSGYREPYGNATLSYRDYAAQVVAHYASEPTILGWSLMNEAETDARDADGRSALVGFASDMASVVRSADPNHLITLGTQSNSAPGASGPDFTDVYGIPALSFAEVHDWGNRGSDTAPMPGSSTSVPPDADSTECAALDAPVGCSFARGVGLDKPLIVGEAGMTGTTEDARRLRAERLGAKMDAAFAAGASGYLVWSVTGADTDGYDVSVDGDDPLLDRMRAVAAKIE